MESCDRMAALLARAADGSLASGEEAQLSAHLEGCAACRGALAAQREVAAALRSRQDAPVPAGFQARLAARLHPRPAWLDLADWRAWSYRIAPVPLGLALVAVLSGVPDAPSANGTSWMLQAWAQEEAEDAGVTASFLQPDATGDALLESVFWGVPEEER